MIRKLVVALAFVALLALASPAGSATAATAKAGATCTKLNQQVVVNYIKLKCVKLGTKKVWKRIGSVPRPKPTPSPTATPTAAPITFDQTSANANVCRLPQSSYRDDVQSGWPRNPARINPVGEIRYAMLFVDFASKPATTTPQSVHARISPMSENEFTEQSKGRLSLKYIPKFEWMRLPGDGSNYDLKTFAGHRQLIADAVAAADASFDFSKIDGVVVITDPESTPFSYGPALTAPTFLGIQADGRNIYNGTNSGADLKYWGHRWANHEISHNFGLPDLYSYKGNTQATVHGFVGDFSYMGSINGSAPGLTGWERWSLDWLTDSQLLCEPKVGQIFELSPVAGSSGTRMAVLKISSTRALVLEMRKPTGIDLGVAQDGILAYVVDTTIASGEGTIQVIPEQSGAYKNPTTALFELDDVINFESRSVKVVWQGQDSFGIRVIK